MSLRTNSEVSCNSCSRFYFNPDVVHVYWAGQKTTNVVTRYCWVNQISWSLLIFHVNAMCLQECTSFRKNIITQIFMNKYKKEALKIIIAALWFFKRNSYDFASCNNQIILMWKHKSINFNAQNSHIPKLYECIIVDCSIYDWSIYLSIFLFPYTEMYI